MDFTPLIANITTIRLGRFGTIHAPLHSRISISSNKFHTKPVPAPDTAAVPIPEELDPAHLAELPSSKRLPIYKKLLKSEDKRVRKIHESGAGGCEVAALRCAAIDNLLRSLFETALLTHKAPATIALVANGGYGRGLLSPGSDLDLLFLLPQHSHKLSKKLKEVVEGVLYPLFDLGFKVGHASRSIAECVKEARKDPVTRTSLFDDRLLSGDQGLFAKFKQRFRQDCIDKDREKFFAERRADIEARYRKFSSTVFLQEPNLKESPGAMRDFHNLLWISDALFQTRDLDELVGLKILTPRSEEHTSELQSRRNLVCRLLLEKKKK